MSTLTIPGFIDRLQQYLSPLDDDIALVFLFGSAVTGHLGNASDIDIAILFQRKPNLIDITDLIDRLSGVVNKEVDLVVLNNASPIIKMQVLKNGILLKSKGDAFYNDFFVKTIKEYEDLKFKRLGAEKNILKGRIYA